MKTKLLIKPVHPCLWNNKYLLLVAFLCLSAFSKVKATQLSGNYSINASQAASATNFKNFASAITYLTGSGTRTDGGPSNAAPFGVAGPVVFVVAPGTFSEQVTMSTAIPGASPINTVTFQGSSPAACIITFAATSTAAMHTVRLSGVKYVCFRDLTIRATGTSFGWGVQVATANSNCNKIKNCMINISGNGTTSASTNYAGIVVSGSNTTPTTGIRIDSLEIDSNTINSGYYGIVTSGLSTNIQLSNKIRGNKIYESYQYGIYTTYQDGLEVSGNTIVPRLANASNYGIGVLNSNSNTTLNGIVISGNRVSNFGVYGIYVFTVANNFSGSKGLITNNMVGGGVKAAASSPIAITGSSYWTVANNTVLHDIVSSAPQNAALNITGGSGISVLNNILVESSGGPGLPFYATTAPAIDSIDRNIYYCADTTNGLLYRGGYYFPSTFKGAAWADSGSMFMKPLFYNDTNLHIYNNCYRGVALPYVTKDIDGNARNTQPVIGAHEPAPLATTLSLGEVVAPGNNITAGAQDLVVRVQNSGSNVITSFSITYRLNNGTPVTQPWIGTLMPCDTATVVFTGTNSINLGSVNYVKIYTSLPNGGADDNRGDDTLAIKYFTSLSGTYTVGSGGDFASLRDVVTALQTKGITAAVTFRLNPGTFNEQVVLTGPLTGASPQNTITFDGISAATRIITASVPSGATVILNQCSYVHFRNITINNTYPGSCTGFAFAGNNNVYASLSIRHCAINLSNDNTAMSIGILVTGSSTGFGLSDNRIDSVEIDSNTINGVNTGIHLTGNGVAATSLSNAYNHGYKIRNNVITCTTSQGDIGININNMLNGMEISYNKTDVPNGTGLQLFRALNDFSGNTPNYLVGNKIKAGSTGINFQQITSGTANPMLIANNEVYLHSNLLSVGIYYSNITGRQVDRLYNNTVYIDSSSALLLGYVLYYSGDSTSEIKNNIFAYAGSGSATVYPVYIEKGPTGNRLDNNLYFNAALDSLIFREGRSIGSANFQTDSTGGSGSFNSAPSVVSNTDLHLSSGCPRGTNLTAIVPFDLDGQPRSIAPSIGCYEFFGFADDIAVLQVLQPVAPYNAGAQDLRVKIANRGNNTVNSFNTNYRFNNGAVVTQSWSGTLAPCDTVSVLFSGANQINILNGQNTLTVYTNNPNSLTDGNRNNDTLRMQFAPPLSGTYIIGPAPSDFLTFTAAVSALNLRGVNGPVIFNAKSGVYNESFTFSAITGSSAVNTVTFQSLAGHRDSVSINYSGTNVSVITYTGASYITLRNLSINQQLDDDFRSAVYMGANSSYDTIENCNLTVPPYTAHSTITLYTGSYYGTGLVVRGNKISGGYGTVLVNIIDAFVSAPTEHKNMVFENNTILDAQNYSCFFYRSTNLICRNNIISTTSPDGFHNAIALQNCDSAVQCTGNKITGQAGGYGISIAAGVASVNAGSLVANNMISFGSGNNASYGIYCDNMASPRIYHNSVNITASGSGGYGGYFTAGSALDIKNNVFCNTGGGPAIYASSAVILNSDHNSLYTTGTNLARLNNTNHTSLTAWRTATAGDRNSICYRPGFTSSTELMPDAADSACWSLNGRGRYLDSALIRTDINGNGRPHTLAAGVPDIGAYQFTPSSLPPLATVISGTLTAGDSQVFVFAGDTVAKLLWSPFNNPPLGIAVRQYSGEKPPGISATDKFMYFYIDVKDSGLGGYFYNADIYYKDIWLGTIPNEADIRLIQKANVSWSLPANSQVDSGLNKISGQYLSWCSWLTGTDLYNPLPVVLFDLTAHRAKDDVLLNWSTASEKNSSYFEIERNAINSTRGWKKAGTVKAAGNSNSRNNYRFIDRDAASLQAPVLFYRIKTVDQDGRTAYSKTVNVEWNTGTRDLFTVYPNPFHSEIRVTTNDGAGGNVQVTITDLTGQVVCRQEFEPAGSTNYTVPTAQLQPGIYFMTVQRGEQVRVKKLIKDRY